MSFLALPCPMPDTLTIDQVAEMCERFARYSGERIFSLRERPPVVVEFHEPPCSYLLAADSSHYLLATVAGQPCH